MSNETPVYQLLFGDCLDLLSNLPDGSIDMVLADLPFGTTKQSWDRVLDMDALWSQYKRIVKPSGAIVLFAKPPFDKTLAVSNLRYYRYDWIWEKSLATGHLNSNRMPLQAHENICVFYQRQPTYNAQKSSGHKPVNSFYTRRSGECYGDASKNCVGGGSTERYPRSVLKYPTVPNKHRLHPNQKPVPLLQDLILTYTNIGDVVLDNVMGSGSTGEAALLTGRRFIGMEKTLKTFHIAQMRLSNVLSGVDTTEAK